MNIETVNKLIASLESAGEPSIREQKFLKLAKEFSICSASLDAAIKTGNMLADQNAQLAAENVALVEALEKAQTKAIERGRTACELFDEVTALRQRIAELESRAVTFKLPSTPEPSAFAPWVAKAFYQFHKDTVKSCVAVFSDACRAAGIKVEVE